MSSQDDIVERNQELKKCLFFLNNFSFIKKFRLKKNFHIIYFIEHAGPAPTSTRWTVLCLDLSYILSMYLNRTYAHVKNIRLCANMLVKNIFTSDVLYDPGNV